jgi:hypothetical protein
MASSSIGTEILVPQQWKLLKELKEELPMLAAMIDSHTLSLFTEIIQITNMAVETDRSYQMIDGVTVVRGYAQLSAMYPTVPKYRDDLSRSITNLCALLEGKGNPTLATRIRGVAGGLRTS